jgi:SAM-dependent methyltransferase
MIDYYVVEPWKKYHSVLQKLGIETNNIFTEHTELKSKQFDFIVLCNVLHEIKVDEWEEILNKIIDSLKQNGCLIIIEAKTLKLGEKIEKCGYMLLGIEEIRKLFNLSSFSSMPIEKDKIICVSMQRSELTSISKHHIKTSIDLLIDNTFKKIKDIRQETNKSGKYQRGRETAFLSQQYINAKISQEIIEELIENMEKKKHKASV